MPSFILKNRKPVSQNTRPYAVMNSYQNDLNAALIAAGGILSMYVDDLYGLVHYFHKTKTRLDADNLSKPVWDALEGIVYLNDNIIKLRTSGILAESSLHVNGIDLTYVNGQELSDIIDFFLDPSNTDKHFLYIEFDLLQAKMFRHKLNNY